MWHKYPTTVWVVGYLFYVVKHYKINRKQGVSMSTKKE